MTTQALILILILIGLAILAGLVWLAILGYLIAYIILTGLAVVGLVMLGLSYGFIYQKVAADRQQQLFMDNAQENLGIMQALQRVQNEQNKGLIQQLNQVNRLPQPPSNNGSFLIEDGIFDELD